jgi:hypothetical protein
MATRLAPDQIIETSGLTAGILSYIIDDPTSPDGFWLAASANDSATVVRVGFSPTLAPKAGAGLQVMRAWVRKFGGSGDVTCTPQLYENGVLVRSGTAVAVTSTSGQLITFPFNASEIGTYANTEFRLQTTPAGGSPSKRATVEFGAIDWLFTPDQIPNPMLGTASTFSASPISKLVAPISVDIAPTASAAQVSPVSTALGFRLYWLGLDADFQQASGEQIDVTSLDSSFASSPIGVSAATAITGLASSLLAPGISVSAVSAALDTGSTAAISSVVVSAALPAASTESSFASDPASSKATVALAPSASSLLVSPIRSAATSRIEGTDQTAGASAVSVTGASPVLGTASTFASGPIEQPGGAALAETPSTFASAAVSVMALASVAGIATSASVGAVGVIGATSLNGAASQFAGEPIGSRSTASLVSVTSGAAVSPVTVATPPVTLAGTSSQFAASALTLRSVNRAGEAESTFAAGDIAAVARIDVAGTADRYGASPINNVSRIAVLSLASGFIAPRLAAQDLVVDVAGTPAGFAGGFVVTRLTRPASEVFVGLGETSGAERVDEDRASAAIVSANAPRGLVA